MIAGSNQGRGRLAHLRAYCAGWASANAERICSALADDYVWDDEMRTVSAAGWSSQTATRRQEALNRQRTMRDCLLGTMDPEISKSFTESQLRELERVLASPASRRPPINIRLTVPFLRRRYFMTFLAGRERRSAERLKQDRAKHALWTFANVCSFVFLLLLATPTVIGLLHMLAIAN